MKNEEILFAYGTLREPDIQKRLIGRELEGTPDTLSRYHWTLACSEGKLYPDIASGQDAVHGTVYRVSEDELKKLDVYEGENYIRYQIALESGVVAWVYDNVTIH